MFQVVEDPKQLAVCCLYLLAGKAIPDFPGTTRAAPSLWVVVTRSAGKPLREKDLVLFPCQVRWYIWQEIVIPGLAGFWNQGLVRSDGNYEILLGQLEAVLRALMLDHGLLPAGNVSAG